MATTVLAPSNHVVTRHGDLWVKRPGPAHDAVVRLGREALVLERLGRTVRLDDAGALIIEHLGDPLPEPVDEATVAEMIHQLSVYRATDTSGLNLPAADRWVERAVVTAANRLSTDHRLTRLLVQLAQAKPAQLHEHRWGLLHCDAHPGNWVRSASGSLVLIDWESASIGPMEIDLACAGRVLVETVGPHVEDLLRSACPDPELFDWALDVKTVMRATWLTWRRGEECSSLRLRGLLDAHGL